MKIDFFFSRLQLSDMSVCDVAAHNKLTLLCTHLTSSSSITVGLQWILACGRTTGNSLPCRIHDFTRLSFDPIVSSKIRVSTDCIHLLSWLLLRVGLCRVWSDRVWIWVRVKCKSGFSSGIWVFGYLNPSLYSLYYLNCRADEKGFHILHV